MTNFLYYSGVTTGNETLAANELGYIGRDATVQGSISGNADNMDIRILGALVTITNTAAVGVVGNNISVFVGATGTVNSLSFSTTNGIGVEIDVQGGGAVGQIFNAGEISGRNLGIFAYAQAATDTQSIRNTGTIFGQTGGILTAGLGQINLVNSGLISGLEYGITNFTFSYNFPANSVSIVNSGTIEGSTAAIRTGSLADTVVNTGQIRGDVLMGDAIDSFVNRAGTVDGDIHLGDGNDRYVGTGANVTGAVYGDAGADTFFGNQNAADVFVGGADVDTLDFRLGGQVTLALDLSFAQNGAALGDTYFEMENVFGSDIGNDVIRGNGAANALFGWGGNDSLDGASGNDVLRGGTGIDTLTGGIGNDTFRFSALNECGDLITDFGNILSSDDRFQITAAAFGGGLVAGVLAASQFITRADHLAQDADDRFIFNTTDRTLWFDADGSGAGAAVMVADLQAGAIVTAADILLI